jgi:rod shape-determining protein MreC
MFEFQSRIRLSLLVVVLVGAATVSMVVDRRALYAGRRNLPAWAAPVLDAAVPVQKAVALPVDLVRGGWSRYVALVGAHEQNDSLRGELARLLEENARLREALEASGHLEDIADMRRALEVQLLPVELVGSDLSPWFRSVLLDHGRSDGVRSGMPVIAKGGLVGLVTATSRTAAKTMLLLDRQAAVDGTVQRSRTRGIVRGRGGDDLAFEFEAREADVQLGDLVITSGLDGVYPKELLVGIVTALPEAGSQLLQTATLRPAVDFGRLERAFVMLRRGPTMELLYTAGHGDTVPEQLASEQDAAR